jgi:hypothetical protein
VGPVTCSARGCAPWRPAGLRLRTVTHGGAPAAAAGVSSRWVPLQYVQHLDLLLQHPDKNICNIQLKHLHHTSETLESNCKNICSIPIYFCNIHMKHLQHTCETPKTLKIYACNMHVMQHPYILLQYPDETFEIYV